MATVAAEDKYRFQSISIPDPAMKAYFYRLGLAMAICSPNRTVAAE